MKLTNNSVNKHDEEHYKNKQQCKQHNDDTLLKTATVSLQVCGFIHYMKTFSFPKSFSSK